MKHKKRRKNQPRKLELWSGGDGRPRIRLSDQTITSRPNAKKLAEKMRQRTLIEENQVNL